MNILIFIYMLIKQHLFQHHLISCKIICIAWNPITRSIDRSPNLSRQSHVRTMCTGRCAIKFQTFWYFLIFFTRIRSRDMTILMFLKKIIVSRLQIELEGCSKKGTAGFFTLYTMRILLYIGGRAFKSAPSMRNSLHQPLYVGFQNKMENRKLHKTSKICISVNFHRKQLRKKPFPLSWNSKCNWSNIASQNCEIPSSIMQSLYFQN